MKKHTITFHLPRCHPPCRPRKAPVRCTRSRPQRITVLRKQVPGANTQSAHKISPQPTPGQTHRASRRTTRSALLRTRVPLQRRLLSTTPTQPTAPNMGTRRRRNRCRRPERRRNSIPPCRESSDSPRYSNLVRQPQTRITKSR